jgi:hypothetical protein
LKAFASLSTNELKAEQHGFSEVSLSYKGGMFASRPFKMAAAGGIW